MPMPRALDVLLAGLALVALLPVVLWRAAVARGSNGRVFERAPVLGRGARPGQRRWFAGPRRGRALAALVDVLCGELSLVGPRPLSPRAALRVPVGLRDRFMVRPGLVSRAAVRERLGVAYESEFADDAAFARTATWRDSLGLLARALFLRVAFGPRPADAAPRRFRLLGVGIDNARLGEAVEWIVGRAVAGRATQVAFVNPHCLNVAAADPAYRRVLDGCTRVFADGSGIRLACGLRGVRLLDNVNGTDLFAPLLERAAAHGLSVYLLGARPGIAAATAAAMQRQLPRLRVAGTRDGYFGAAEEAAVVDEINASGAAILLVALGVPHQEQWVARHADRLTVPVRIGVGGLFDFFSGRIPRAPGWLRELGLEWCWRLWQEPRRMWRRYLVGNVAFLARVRHESRASDAGTAAVMRLYRDGRLQRARRHLRLHAQRLVWQATLRLGRVAKRTLDVVVAAIALMALSPVLALLALLIRLDSRGPVLFAQTRVGRHGAPFTMLKFRSMYVDAEARKAALLASNEMRGGVTFKMRDDPRITRVGRWLRKLSLDELPQLWHVLRGEMTLVGPRPPVPAEVAQYAPADRRRLEATPGITCLWQVSGRSQIPFDRQVELDVAYIERQSLWLDVVLLLRTVPAVLLGRGAY